MSASQTPPPPEPPKEPDEKQSTGSPLADHLPVSRNTARLISAGIQLVSVVGGMALLGYWIDQWTDQPKPWFTLGGAVLGIIAGLVNLIRDYMRG